jgi:DNA-binding MarR family transcriptional regulator
VAREDQRSESAILLLQRATHVTLDVLSQRLAHLRLTPGEINVLANLVDGEEPTVSELSRQVGTPLTTMTSMLDRLVRRDLITRHTPESNRRTVVISLTPAGYRIATEAHAAISQLEAELTADLTTSQLAGLRQTLGLLGRPRPWASERIQEPAAWVPDGCVRSGVRWTHRSAARWWWWCWSSARWPGSWLCSCWSRRATTSQYLNLSGSFWSWFENIDINVLGFLIVGMFGGTWAIALSAWHLGHIEERWSLHLDEGHVEPAG